MYKMLFVVVLVYGVLFSPQQLFAEGKPRHHKHQAGKVVPCNKQKGKARKRCEARAAAIERARRLAAIRYERAQQALENRMRLEAKTNIAKDDAVGEDLEVRGAVIDALDGKAGTAMVMEAQTGKVLALVNKSWGVHQSFKPCSTIKLVTGVAGIRDDYVDEDETAEDTEFSEKFDRALAKSDNSYFQRLGTKVGNEKFVDTAQKLGMGKPTGLNIPGEASGQLPLVKKTVLQYSHGDGSKLTIMQLGILATEITNGGLKPTPTIVKDTQTNLPKPILINVSQEVLKEMIPGMEDVAKYGTARKSLGALYGVAGKTGTCSDEISRMGLFTSVAPVSNPKYTVVVVIRGRKDQTNGPYAAIIAGKIYQFLFSRDNSLAKAGSPVSAGKTQ